MPKPPLPIISAASFCAFSERSCGSMINAMSKFLSGSNGRAEGTMYLNHFLCSGILLSCPKKCSSPQQIKSGKHSLNIFSSSIPLPYFRTGKNNVLYACFKRLTASVSSSQHWLKLRLSLPYAQSRTAISAFLPRIGLQQYTAECSV